MKITRIGAAVFAGATIAALGLSASPAFADAARTLSPGSTLYAIDCSMAPQSLYSVDATTAASTLVSTTVGAPAPECAGPAAWNPATGTVFYIGWSFAGAQLKSMDPVTGTSTSIGAFTVSGNPVSPDSMAIGLDGQAYAIVEGSSSSQLYSLDLGTGALDYIADTGESSDYYYAFSADPTTGVFYVISTDGQLATLNTTTGVQTPVGDPVGLVYSGDDETNIEAMTIDRSGIIWVQNYGDEYSDLWSIDPADLTAPQLVGAFATDPSDVQGSQFDTESLFLIPGAAPVVTAPVVAPQAVTPVASPALAETGVNDTELTAMGFAAVAAILLGAGSVVAGRLRRKARA